MRASSALALRLLVCLVSAVCAVYPALEGEGVSDGGGHRGGHHHDGGRRHHHHLHHRKSDNGSKAVTGLWQVMDPLGELHGHKHPPSCVLAQFRAHLTLPIQTANGAVENKTIVIPDSAKASGKCGNGTRQMLNLVWNNTRDSGKLVQSGSLTLLFTKEEPENAVYLTDVWASVSLFLENGDVSVAEQPSQSQNVMLSVKDTMMWRTPVPFAFVCHSRMEMRLRASTLPVQQASDDILIIDPIYNDEGFLVFDELRLETFRQARFTSHFTHLKYDCRTKWAYEYMPWVVGIALVALCVFVAILFLFRERLGCVGHLMTEDEVEAEKLDKEKIEKASTRK